MNTFKMKLLVGIALPAFALGGCSAYDQAASGLAPFYKNVDRAEAVHVANAESLLEAENGLWDLVEQKEETYDPVPMHKMARAKVNPSDKSKKRFLPEERLAMAAGASSGNDRKQRLIRVARPEDAVKAVKGSRAVKKEIVVAEATPAVKPVAKSLQTAKAGRVQAQKETSSLVEVILGGGNRRVQQALSRTAGHETARSPVDVVSTVDKVAHADAPRPVAKPLRSIEVASAEAEVSRMRLGEHPHKTRLVLDLSGEVKYRTKLDSSGKILTVELPHAGWRTTTRSVLQSPLIAGYTAKPSDNGNGTKLMLELKKPAKIIGAAALRPDHGKPHRIYFDIGAA